MNRLFNMQQQDFRASVEDSRDSSSAQGLDQAGGYLLNQDFFQTGIPRSQSYSKIFTAPLVPQQSALLQKSFNYQFSPNHLTVPQNTFQMTQQQQINQQMSQQLQQQQQQIRSFPPTASLQSDFYSSQLSSLGRSSSTFSHIPSVSSVSSAPSTAAPPVAPPSSTVSAFPTTAASSDVGSAPSRTVYLGNVPGDISPHELLNHVRSGIVESLRIIPSKNCAFVSFLDQNSAMLFHSDANLKRLTIGNHEIKIGWGKQTPVPPIVASCVAKYHATRNVYLGNLYEAVTEGELEADLSEYGEIEAVKVLREKRIAFVHFTTILAAIRCVQALPLVPKYRDRKVFYGKDRCAFITKTQQHNAAQYLGLNPNSENLLRQVDRETLANALYQQSNAAAAIATTAGGAANMGNRTIYLGNLHPETTIEEICNVVRGGILQNVRPIPERHVCFVTFVDPVSAAQFFAMSSLNGLIIHNRKIKVGWGKHSGPLPNSLSLAVGNGASRNIYIGGLDKIPETSFTRSKLYEDFKEFGDIEQINFFGERHCCFVNFTNISNAIKAIDGIRNNPDYLKCKINFGKDRCGNMPRQYQPCNVRHQSHSHSATDSSHSSRRGSPIFGQPPSTAPAPAPVLASPTDFLRYPLFNPDQPPPLRPLQQPQFGAPSPASSASSLRSPRKDSDVDSDASGFVNDGAAQFGPLGIIMGGVSGLGGHLE